MKTKKNVTARRPKKRDTQRKICVWVNSWSYDELMSRGVILSEFLREALDRAAREGVSPGLPTGKSA